MDAPLKLDEDTLYRAIASRDRRFDGHFVIGVVTTGVYCRPGCPAPLPRQKNVRFFVTGAAAETAGFRACLRCRPEASPGAPVRLGTKATVSRAIHLIDKGALDGEDVGGLAGKLGVGERHLRRLFAEHLGTSPVAVARSRRAHFAKKLTEETMLPMTEVALAAGFSSTRRFNDELRRTFGRSPTELRDKAKRSSNKGALDASPLALRLAYKPPLDWASLSAFLAGRATPGVEVMRGDVYQRSISLDGITGILTVERAEGHLWLRVPPAFSRVLLPIALRVQRLFDLSADPAAIAAHLERDPALAPACQAHPGLRVPGAWDGFEVAVRAVLGQQVSVKGATTLAGRLAASFGAPIGDGSGGETEIRYLFPRPEALANADVVSIGIPAARAETIRSIARAVIDGSLDFEAQSATPRLLAIPGIGPWTAAYVAMRAMGDPDALPASDLGLRKALGGITPKQIEARAEAWRPWRSYAVMMLWAG